MEFKKRKKNEKEIKFSNKNYKKKILKKEKKIWKEKSKKNIRDDP